MVTYKESGVDIDSGNRFVEEIKPLVKSTFNSLVLAGIGGFAGGIKLPKGYKNPVIFGATDGVGTKLKLAIEFNKFDTIGIDLVAMCVNDLICNFAKPIFFLDYFATSKLKVEKGVEIIKGVVAGCKEAEVVLIGGETAEMPGLYQKDDFDLAGFAIGIAEEDELKKKPKEGDRLIALPSSGIHSNGFSLVRKLIKDYGLKLTDEELLKPTKIYVKDFLKVEDKINALAHITGGGIVENLPRVLKENQVAVIKEKEIRVLEVFEKIGKFVEKKEMFRTFNMGIGLILVVPENRTKEVLDTLEDAYEIGWIERGKRGVEFI